MNPSTDTIKNTLGVSHPPRTSRKKYLWGSVAVALLAIGGGTYAFFRGGDEDVAYESAPVIRTTLTTTVSATGNLEPTNSVDVGIEVSGTIKEVLVDYNDRVRTGQVMARLDTTRLASALESSKSALARTRANVAEAKASLGYARSEWERVEKMYTATQGNYPSRQERDNARAALEKAQAQVDAAVAQSKQAADELATSQYNLDRAIVVSPIDGIVLERKVEPGQTVVASMQTPVLFTMAEDLTKMQVILSVDEADVGEVRENQRVEFTVDAYPDRRFKGTITQLRLNSEIVNGVVTYDTVVDVNNTDLLLRPGMTVSAHITTGKLENVLAVPNAALRFTPPLEKENGVKKGRSNTQSQHVWVMGDKTPVQVEVKAGKSDGAFTAVEGLEEGQNVLVGTKRP